MDNEILKEIMGSNINDETLMYYLEEMKKNKENCYISIEDSKLKTIALAFQLVIEENFNPFDIDLIKFTTLFLKKVREENLIDFITAGKLIHMAWEILYIKSEKVLEKFSPIEEDFYGEWTPYEISPSHEYNYEITDTIIHGNPLTEPIRHINKRQITFNELLGALKEAIIESEKKKKELIEKKEIENKYRIMVGERMHRDTLEEDIKEIWSRIAEMEDEFIKRQIEDGTKEDSIKTMISLLFLESSGKLEMYQEKPFKDIYIHILIPKELRKIEFLPIPKVEVISKKS
ncbi:MAG: hypothetical protein QXY47_03690 [Thermoplasmata archaeon]